CPGRLHDLFRVLPAKEVVQESVEIHRSVFRAQQPNEAPKFFRKILGRQCQQGAETSSYSRLAVFIIPVGIEFSRIDIACGCVDSDELGQRFRSKVDGDSDARWYSKGVSALEGLLINSCVHFGSS